LLYRFNGMLYEIFFCKIALHDWYDTNLAMAYKNILKSYVYSVTKWCERIVELIWSLYNNLRLIQSFFWVVVLFCSCGCWYARDTLPRDESSVYHGDWSVCDHSTPIAGHHSECSCYDPMRMSPYLPQMLKFASKRHS
jgi:hypothetical protein